ncbi:MAG: hypothetical protein RL732_1052 [Bacteroidota bacterium]|jgi:uncharacterized protein (TIGR02453 family)
MIQPQTLQFLRKLKKNNHKAWMDEHRSDYEEAKKNFESFIQQLIDGHASSDPSLKGIAAKSCIFRINRDIRFSKNKSPYKTNMGAFINKGGKKAVTAGYYFHLEPGNSFAGGGLYMPQPPELAKVRQEIDYNFTEFKKIITSSSFQSNFGTLDTSEEYQLARLPKGYETGHPATAYLKLKSFTAFKTLSDQEVTSKNLLKATLKAFSALQPLLAFLNQGIEDS